MAENILTNQQISGLYRQVAKAFAEDGAEQLTIDLNIFKRQVDTILKQVKVVQITTERGNKHWTLYNATPKRQALAARGYVLIFKFREWLLNEQLNYRYYYEDNQGNLHATEMTEANIMNFIRFGREGLQIDPTAAKGGQLAAAEYDSLVNQYYQKYMSFGADGKNAYVQKGNKYGFLVRSHIMQLYENMNSGLRAKDGRYQVFNKGHIIEALDTAISDIVTHDFEISDSLMETYVFGKHLQLDHIKASQGADNNFTKTSIKSGSADLYDFSTIRAQLEVIQQILNGGLNKEQAEEQIIKLFMHSSKYANGEEFQKTADIAINKLFDEMQKQFNKK